MDIWLVVIFITAVIAFALSAISGGGASFIMLPALALVLPGAQIPAALSIGTAVSSVSRMAAFGKNIRWDIVVWFVPAALPSVWLGAWLLSSMNPVLLELFIGIFLVINIPYIIKPKAHIAETVTGPKWLLILIGMATGFVSGLTGAVGLLFNRFYLTYGLGKEEIIATRAANELLLHIVKITLYSFFGLLTIKAVSMGLVISLAAIIAAMTMKRLIGLLSDKLFQRIGFSAMVLSGVFMIGNAVSSLYRDKQLQFSMYKLDKGLETKMKWRQASFSLEFEYDEGFEIERSIKLTDLTADRQQIVNKLSNGADKVLLEEVHGYRDKYYEVYVYRAGKLNKHNINCKLLASFFSKFELVKGLLRFS